ncbi:MAG: PEP-CTERM sorting domain-containing protein [Planctomycetes bacterium]|nr:PEP-CTERM sorting domain-containing protein [Planctomycetota bacterium]
MRNTRSWARSLAAAAVLVLALTAGSLAAPEDFPQTASLAGFNIGATATGDVGDAVGVYLGGDTFAMVTDMDIADLGQAVSQGPMADIMPSELTVVAYHAPAAAAEALPAVEPPARLATFVYPEATGLAGIGTDGRAVPLGDARNLAMGPAGYGGFMTGRPSAGIANWTHANQTAISYIRPHVNVQMMFALEVPGTSPAGSFEGPGMQPHAYLAIEHETKVDSADLGQHTEQFGARSPVRSVDEPQTAVAAGIDLGLLPTFLSQMGMSVSVVASRGDETGNLRIALVGTTELPVDWAPRERPYQHPVGKAVEPYVLASIPPEHYLTGSGGSHRFPEDVRRPGPTPIRPVPEPATLVMVLGAAAVAIVRRRRRGR